MGRGNVELGRALFERIGGNFTDTGSELAYMHASGYDAEIYATELLTELRAMCGWTFSDDDRDNLAAYMRYADTEGVSEISLGVAAHRRHPKGLDKRGSSE